MKRIRYSGILVAVTTLGFLSASVAASSATREAAEPGLEQRIDRLTRLMERDEAVREIQNLMGTMAYLYEAGMYEERLQYFARHTPGVSVEIGARGIFLGSDGARRAMVTVERNFEQSHIEGMRRLFPGEDFGTDHTGMFESELMGTPVIEIAGDGQTARGQWISLMTVGKTHRDDPAPQALWIWWKTSVDFVFEDGEWRIWHYLKNPYYAAPYGRDWVQNSLSLPPPPPPGEVAPALVAHGGDPDRPPEHYDSYRITRDARLDPAPPIPYETFDPANSYGPS